MTEKAQFDATDADDQLKRAAQSLRQAARVAVLTGAGISAESGLPTFRGAGGLWEGQRVEDVATPQAFRRDPELVWRFYHARRAALRSVQPNAGHLALVELEQRLGDERFTLITQNVDGLHRAAGSKQPLELHGNLARVRCSGCRNVEDRGQEELPPLPHCDRCGELLRPDIVWFNEALPEDIWVRADCAARTCDCFLVIGTSGIVYPAAGLVDRARGGGACVIEINLEQTRASGQKVITLLGPAGQVLPELVRMME